MTSRYWKRSIDTLLPTLPDGRESMSAKPRRGPEETISVGDAATHAAVHYLTMYRCVPPARCWRRGAAGKPSDSAGHGSSEGHGAVAGDPSLPDVWLLDRYRQQSSRSLTPAQYAPGGRGFGEVARGYLARSAGGRLHEIDHELVESTPRGTRDSARPAARTASAGPRTPPRANRSR